MPTKRNNSTTVRNWGGGFGPNGKENGILGKKVKVPLGTLSSLFIKSDPKTLCLYAKKKIR
jgi:hypothetical protein